MNHWLMLAISASAGCVMLIVVLIGHIAHESGNARSATRMSGNRTPLYWRTLSWPISMLASQLAPLLTARTRLLARERIRRADLDQVLTPESFVSGRLLSALLACGLAAALLSPRGLVPWWIALVAILLGYALPASWLRDRIESRRRAVLRDLPFYLDVLTLSIESGLNVASAFVQAVDKGPRGPLRDEFGRMLRDLRTGRPREEALRAVAERLQVPAVASLVSALLVAEKQGASLGAVLRAQAEQRRNERFMRAEKLAMEAPVKMLAPLLLFIFPCTFVVLLFPVVSRFIQEGWLN